MKAITVGNISQNWVNIHGVTVNSTSNMIWKLNLLFGREKQIVYSNVHETILSSIRIVGLSNRDCVSFTLEYVDLVQEGFKKVYSYRESQFELNGDMEMEVGITDIESGLL